MKILKLSSKYCIILFVFNFFWQISSANEPVDIWKIKKLDNSNDTKEENSININSEIIQGVKIEQQNENIIVNKIQIKIGNYIVAEQSRVSKNYNEKDLKEYMKWDSVDVEVNLNIGSASHTVYTCDFTHDYIDINADYRN